MVTSPTPARRPSTGSASVAPRSLSRWPKVLKFLRRGHLYAGLFLAPRIVAYATAALMFNHPGLRGAEKKTNVIMATLPAEGVPHSCPAGDTACAAALVKAVYAAVNSKLPASTPPGTFEVKSLDSVLSFSSTQIPTLRGTQRWNISIQQTGALAQVIAVPETRSLRWQDLLMQLHMTHGFPQKGAEKAPGATPFGIATQWIWAVAVDLLALLLLYWATTGVLMWWQIRSIRLSGGIVLAVGFIAAFGLGIAMTLLIRKGP